MNGPREVPHRTLNLIILVLLGFWLAGPQATVATIWTADGTVHAPSLEDNLVGDSPDRCVTVLLPPGYHGSAERYPVVYFLHGAFADNRKWMDEAHGGTAFHLDEIAGALYEQNAIRPMILVMPDGSMRYQFNPFCNSPVVGNWEDFVTRDLVAHIDHAYRTIPQAANRGISGHSAGGYGAMRLAIKHPDVFGAVYSISGVMGDIVLDRPLIAKMTPMLEELEGVDDVLALDGRRRFWMFISLSLGALFTPNPNQPPLFVDWPFDVVDGAAQSTAAMESQWEANRVLSMIGPYADQLAQLRPVHFDAGTEDGITIDGNRAFDAALTEAGIPHVYEEYEGNHENRVSERLGRRVLPYFSEVLGSGGRSPQLPRVHSFTPAVVASAVGQPTPLQVAVKLENGEPLARLMLDLSALGRPEPLLLDGTGEADYTVGTMVTPGRSGQHVLPLRVETVAGERFILIDMLLNVGPSEDLAVFADAPAVDWSVQGKRGAQVDVQQRDVVHAGVSACAIQAEKSFAGWIVSFLPTRAMELYGYKALRFAFHPGDVVPGSSPRFTATTDPGKGVNLLTDGRVDLERREWQMVEVPLVAFEAGSSPASVNLAGSFGGTFHVDDVSLVSRVLPGLPTVVVEERGAASPATFALQQNYPNPFNSHTVIALALPGPGGVELAAYNAAGQKVATLLDGHRAEGVYTIRWDGRDDGGRELASGMYAYRLRTGDRVEARKLLLVR